MSQSQSEPTSHSPYASLRTEAEAGKAAPGANATAASASEPGYLAAEAERLESLRLALFAAFLAAPKSGIPTALVDLAATYTSALRLQLNLMGYRAVPQRSARAAGFAAGRGKGP